MEQENFYDSLEVEELQNIIKQTRAYNTALRKENRLLESFANRTGIGLHGESIPAEETTLSMEQRFIIATSELKDLQEESQQVKEASEKTLDELRVTMNFCPFTEIVSTRRNRYSNCGNEKRGLRISEGYSFGICRPAKWKNNGREARCILRTKIKSKGICFDFAAHFVSKV